VIHSLIKNEIKGADVPKEPLILFVVLFNFLEARLNLLLPIIFQRMLGCILVVGATDLANQADYIVLDVMLAFNNVNLDLIADGKAQ
jgi:hypothetical protein